MGHREISSTTGWDTLRKKLETSYSKLRDDATFRQEWAERIGLGFDLVHIGPQSEVKVVTKKEA